MLNLCDVATFMLSINDILCSHQLVPLVPFLILVELHLCRTKLNQLHYRDPHTLIAAS